MTERSTPPARPVMHTFPLRRGGGGPTAGRRHTPHDRRLMAVTMLALAGFGLQQSSINAMLPGLQQTFAATTAWSTWVVTAFLLLGAVATPLVGRLADQFGRILVLRATLVIFALACVGAALAPNIGVLIVFRAVCGVSAAFLALGVALVAERQPAERVAGATALLAVAMASTNIVGVTVAPQIAEHLSWRWAFAANALLPVAALLLSVGMRQRIANQRRHRVDVVGTVLLMLAIGTLMLALTEGDALGWGSAPIVLLLTTSTGAAAAWAWVELHTSEPLIDPRMIARGVVLLTNTAVLLAGAGIFAMMVLVARFVAAPGDLPPRALGLVNYGFGAGPVDVGLFLLPTMVVATATASVLGRIASRRGWKWPLVGSLATLTVSLVSLAIWHAHAWQVALATAILGLSLSISTVGAKLVADAVPPSDLATVAGMNMVAFYIGGVVGTQGVAAILEAQRIPGTTAPTQGAYSLGLLLLAGATMAGLILAALIPPARIQAEREPLLASTATAAGRS